MHPSPFISDYMSDVSSIASIIAIDPGTSNMGLCVHEFHCVTLETFKITAWTQAVKDRNLREWGLMINSPRREKISFLAECLQVELQQYNPVAVISEAPFFNPKSPDAFQALSQLIERLLVTTQQHRMLTPFYVIEPRSVKKIFSGVGNVDKDGMLSALKTKPALLAKLSVPLSSLDEHSVDAIAISEYLMHQYREKLLPLTPPIF
jgi:Holliday junction resolvasome RuvABC endonuclease subunit